MAKHKPGEDKFENQAPPNQVTIGDVIQKLDRKIKGANNSALQAQDNLEDASNLLIALVQMYEQQNGFLRQELSKVAGNLVKTTARTHELEDLLKANNITIPEQPKEEPTKPT